MSENEKPKESRDPFAKKGLIHSPNISPKIFSQKPEDTLPNKSNLDLKPTHDKNKPSTSIPEQISSTRITKQISSESIPEHISSKPIPEKKFSTPIPENISEKEIITPEDDEISKNLNYDNITQRRNKNNNDTKQKLQDNEINEQITVQKTNSVTISNIKIRYEYYRGNNLLRKSKNDIPIEDFELDLIELNYLIQINLTHLHEKIKERIARKNLNDSLSSCSLHSADMANIPIKDITDLIREYKGEEKDLNTFIKNVDKLWKRIENYEENDKTRFLLILQ